MSTAQDMERQRVSSAIQEAVLIDEDSKYLYGSERNNPQNLPTILEKLENQLSQGTFDQETDMLLLTLYEFNPESADFSNVHSVLLKAIMHISEARICVFESLLSEKMARDSKVQTLLGLAKHLDNSEYAQFWTTLKESGIDYSKVIGFVENIRKFIIVNCKNLYSTVQTKHMCSNLGLNEKELAEYASKNDMVIENGNVILNKEHETNITSRRILEDIKFIDINKMCCQVIVQK